MLEKITSKQFLPTLEDIKNEEVKKLAERLKNRTDKETLTNVLDWQERNIQFWEERLSMSNLLLCLLVISIWFLPIADYNVKIIVTVIFALLAVINLAYLLSYLIPLIACIIALLTLVISVNPSIFPLVYLVLLSITWGGLVFLLIYLILKYRNIKSRYPEFKLGDTFRLSLSLDKILKYHLAVCRDYAKLTAALLLNLYPKNEIYSLLIPNHVATSIKINDKIYVLDQKLPVMTLENWLEYWKMRLKRKKLKADMLEIKLHEKGITIKKRESIKSVSSKIPEIDIENLTNKLAKFLKLKQIQAKRKSGVRITLKNYVIFYDKDEITQFSLIRAIKNKIDNDFCGNANKVSKIKIFKHKRDLILKIHMK